MVLALLLILQTKNNLKYIIMNNKKLLGKLIEEEVRRQQIPITKFADMICCQRNNVYKIFDRSSLHVDQLALISKVLNRNFFEELAIDP